MRLCLYILIYLTAYNTPLGKLQPFTLMTYMIAAIGFFQNSVYLHDYQFLLSTYPYEFYPVSLRPSE